MCVCEGKAWSDGQCHGVCVVQRSLWGGEASLRQGDEYEVRSEVHQQENLFSRGKSPNSTPSIRVLSYM